MKVSISGGSYTVNGETNTISTRGLRTTVEQEAMCVIYIMEKALENEQYNLDISCTSHHVSDLIKHGVKRGSSSESTKPRNPILKQMLKRANEIKELFNRLNISKKGDRYKVRDKNNKLTTSESNQGITYCSMCRKKRKILQGQICPDGHKVYPKRG